MMVGRLCGGLVLALLLLGGAGPASAERLRAVLELFTSQGCSSCPPADRYVSEMAERRDVLALTFAVDYWDYLGWRDTLAVPHHAKRQKAYALVRGDRQIYTPQMIVNGIGHAIGSDRGAVERTVEQTRERSAALSVPVTLRISGDTVTVTLPAGNGGLGPENPATVLALAISSRQSVEIARGENRGQTVVYRNVVRSHANLGEWQGGPRTFTLSRGELGMTEADRVAILVQAGTLRRPGVVLGAAIADLPPLASH